MKEPQLNVWKRTVLGIICVVGVLSFAYSVFQNEKQSLTNSVSTELLEAVTQQTAVPERVFTVSHATLKGLIQDEHVIDFLAHGGKETERKDIEKMLSHFNIDNYPSIYLMIPSGLCVAATDQNSLFLGNNYTFRDYFKMAIQGISWTDMAVGSTTKLPGYYFSEPVKDSSGKIIGVAATKLDNAVIEKSLLSDAIASLNASIMLADSDGVIIFSQKPDRLYKTLAPFGDQKKQELIAKKKFGPSTFETLHFGPVYQAIHAYSKPITVEFTDPADQRSKIAAITRISDSPFYIVAEVDKNSALLTAGADVIRVTIYVSIMIIFSLVMTYFYMRNQSKLKENEKVRAALEKAVAERTEDLKKTNAELEAEIHEKEKIEDELRHKNEELEKFNKVAVDRELKMIELKETLKSVKDNSNPSDNKR